MEDGKWKIVDERIGSPQSLLHKCHSEFISESQSPIGSWQLAADKFLFGHLQLIFFLLFTMISFLNIKAQSVDSLINEALQNNPQLKALEFQIKSAEYGSESFGYLPPPTLGIEFNQIPTDEINIWDKALSQSLSISQMFPLGGKLTAMEKAERKNIDIAETDYESYKLKLISEIKKLYYDIWLMEHHSELRDEIINLLESIYKSAELQYQVNNARYSDLLLIQAEIASNKTEVEVIENNIRSMIYQMNALLGRDLNDDNLYVLHHINIDTTSFDLQRLEQQLIETNPALLKMERMTEMNQLQIETNNKELIPDLMIGGMLMRMPRGMLLTSKSPVHMLNGTGEVEIMYGLMASITLPFAPWSSGKYSAKEEELLANISGLRSEKENMQREMTAEMKSLVNKINNSRNEIRLYENEVIPLYKKTIEAQLIEFQNNRSSLNSLLETIQMLLMKEEALSEAQTEHQRLLAEIERLLGINL